MCDFLKMGGILLLFEREGAKAEKGVNIRSILCSQRSAESMRWCFLTLFHIGGDGKGADSTRPQTVFLFNSVRDAGEPQYLVNLPRI